MNRSRLEIECSSCGQESLLLREAIYDGLTKTGVILKCASCGHVFSSEEEVPFKAEGHVGIFDESDQSAKVELFTEDEKHILCRYCRHYVINPFTQWCGLQRREVEATDTCCEFERGEGMEPVL